jgi:hypothetical protein
MARTAVPYSNAVINSKIADPAGTAITAGAGNGGQIAGAFAEQTLLRVVGTTAGNLTVKAGAYPPAIAAGQGDLVLAVPANSTIWVGPLESGRFNQADGSLVFESDQAFTVTAFKVPRH